MSISQKAEFSSGEGDAYFQRNKSSLLSDEKIAAKDPVLQVLGQMHLNPDSVLEIGCSNAWRLSRLQQMGAKNCHGLDPSKVAIDAGKAAFPQFDLRVGTADSIPYGESRFDLVIFGFCLYVCDPADHFRIIAEADRVLRDGGHVVIFDFDPPVPYRNPYAHKPGLYSFKMDYAGLFLSHPHYSVSQKYTEGHGGTDDHRPDNRVAVTVIRKDLRSAWPDNPWTRA